MSANNIVVQVLGGAKQVLDGVNSIADIKTKLGLTNYTASVNGDPVADTDSVSDGDFVSLSQAVKGGLI